MTDGMFKRCTVCGKGRHIKHPDLVAGSYFWIWICCKDPKHNEPVDEGLQAAHSDPKQMRLPL